MNIFSISSVIIFCKIVSLMEILKKCNAIEFDKNNNLYDYTRNAI